MDILGVGFPELVFIFIIALMIFGPRRLPEIAARAGKMVRDLRNMSQGLLTEWQREITVAARLEELEAARKEIAEVKQELKQAKQTVTAETATGLNEARKELKSVGNEVEQTRALAASSASSTSELEESSAESVETEADAEAEPSPTEDTSTSEVDELDLLTQAEAAQLPPSEVASPSPAVSPKDTNENNDQKAEQDVTAPVGNSQDALSKMKEPVDQAAESEGEVHRSETPAEREGASETGAEDKREIEEIKPKIQRANSNITP